MPDTNAYREKEIGSQSGVRTIRANSGFRVHWHSMESLLNRSILQRCEFVHDLDKCGPVRRAIMQLSNYGPSLDWQLRLQAERVAVRRLHYAEIPIDLGADIVAGLFPRPIGDEFDGVDEMFFL